MTLKFKNPALYMVLVKDFLENMCALSVSLHFLRALSLLSEREHTKSVKTQRERAQKINREREHLFLFQFIYDNRSPHLR